MRRVCFAVSVMGLVTLASQRARAQEPDTTSAAQRAGFALARLGGGQLVRIHNRRVGRRQGVVVSSSADRLTLETSFWGRIEVPASDVDSLWVRGGGHAGTGALIGAVLGGVALGAGGVAVAKANCEGSVNCGEAGGFVFGLAVGGAVGAGIGALIGSAFPKWRPRAPGLRGRPPTSWRRGLLAPSFSRHAPPPNPPSPP